MQAHRLSVLTLLFLTVCGFSAWGGPAPAADKFPDSWYFNGVERLRELEGKPAPKLSLKNWIGDPTSLEKLKGKIVVVDFWATWCPPCMAALPKNVALQEEYQDDGVVFLGVHDSSRGVDKMAGVAKQKKINYPLAVDNGGQSVKAYRLQFWPTYVVIDPAGIVRGAGLVPDAIERAIKQLLDEGGVDAPKGAPGKEKEPATPAEPAAPVVPDVPAEWLEARPEKQRDAVNKLFALRALPALHSDQWINSDPLALKDLKGKVVVLNFWATWNGPSLTSITDLNALHEKHEKDGLVIIGVCHPRDVEKMAAVAKEKGIRYALCADRTGTIMDQYRVDNYPDYHLIDRTGKLRVADCANAKLAEAITVLLAEK